MNNTDRLTQITNILIIDCGGAGSRAAVEIKKSGLDVCILGKKPKTDAYTVLAAGVVNADLGNLDKEDSWEQHFIHTYLEGYGIGDPVKIEIMAKESPILVKEIDEWRAEFAKLKNGDLDQMFFGAHQRNDFPILDPSCQFNCLVTMDENSSLIVSKSPIKELNENKKNNCKSTKRK